MLTQIQETTLFGIPLPSKEPGFLVAVCIHILLSLAAVMCGLVAMLKDKNSEGHSKFGLRYYWTIVSAFVTVVILSFMRWPHNNHLLMIGTLTVILVFIGRRITKTKTSRWPRLHTICMGGSYILLLTGFYVDNGKNLPFWNLFPQWFFWVLPAIIGIPIILYVLKRHPLTRIRN